MEIDPTLFKAARTMDKDALMQIFDLYAPQLYRYAMHLCRDPLVADHVVGDVFVKLLDQLSLGKGPDSNLQAYLYQTAYHLVIDETRHSRYKVPLEVALSEQEERLDASLSLENQSQMETILHIIQRELSSDQRHVIILRFWEQFSLLETAAILGKRVDHVKVIQARAIAKLRKSLKYEELKKTAFASRIKKSTRISAPRGAVA